jgi:hypothetical protein
MVTREELKEKIEEQLAKWKPAIDGLKTKIEHAEVDARAKLHEQLESLHDKRVKAEKILQDVTTASQDVWEQVKAGAEQGWTDLTRTAKHTVAQVREAIAKPKRDEEIRQIAYHLWLDEGCPHGRQEEHWFKAESIWRARQAEAAQPDRQARAKTKQPRKKPGTPTNAKSRVAKNPGRRGRQSTTDSKEP